MTDRFEMRAADVDRDRVAEILREAHGEGRLTHDELMMRLDAAYDARSYGELDRLIADLPVPRRRDGEADPAAVQLRRPAPRPVTRAESGPGRKLLNAAWICYAFAVVINLTIWLLVSLGNDAAEYFWPIWVAGPWGVTLGFAEVLYRTFRKS